MKYKIQSAVPGTEAGKWEYPGLSTISPEMMAYLDDYLENFDPEIHIATASTRHVGASMISKITGNTTYKVDGTSESFVSGHAYSIEGVNTQEKTITLVNPWDTTKPVILSFDQFKKAFSSFDAIRIDSAKLLENIQGISPA